MGPIYSHSRGVRNAQNQKAIKKDNHKALLSIKSSVLATEEHFNKYHFKCKNSPESKCAKCHDKYQRELRKTLKSVAFLKDSTNSVDKKFRLLCDDVITYGIIKVIYIYNQLEEKLKKSLTKDKKNKEKHLQIREFLFHLQLIYLNSYID